MQKVNAATLEAPAKTKNTDAAPRSREDVVSDVAPLTSPLQIMDAVSFKGPKPACCSFSYPQPCSFLMVILMAGARQVYSYMLQSQQDSSLSPGMFKQLSRGLLVYQSGTV